MHHVHFEVQGVGALQTVIIIIITTTTTTTTTTIIIITITIIINQAQLLTAAHLNPHNDDRCVREAPPSLLASDGQLRAPSAAASAMPLME